MSAQRSSLGGAGHYTHETAVWQAGRSCGPLCKVRHYVGEAAKTTVSVIKLLAMLAVGFLVLTIFPPSLIGGALNNPLVTQLLTLVYAVCAFATGLLVLILAAVLTILK